MYLKNYNNLSKNNFDGNVIVPKINDKFSDRFCSIASLQTAYGGDIEIDYEFNTYSPS